MSEKTPEQIEAEFKRLLVMRDAVVRSAATLIQSIEEDLRTLSVEHIIKTGHPDGELAKEMSTLLISKVIHKTKNSS